MNSIWSLINTHSIDKTKCCDVVTSYLDLYIKKGFRNSLLSTLKERCGWPCKGPGVDVWKLIMNLFATGKMGKMFDNE